MSKNALMQSSLKLLLKKYWPFLVIFLITVLFFWKVILRGLVPIPADITVGLYYPWLDYKWGYEVGVPVKNNLPSDIVSIHLPNRFFAANELRQGRLPLWNNLIVSGTPLIANFQSSVFNPLNLLLFILDTIDAWTIQVMLQPLFASIFTYLLLRHWKLSKLPSLFGAIAFAFSGFSLTWLEYNIHGHVAYWLPVILLLVDKFLTKPRVIYGMLLSVSLALAIFAGYPQLVLYEVLAVGVFLFFRFREKHFLKKVLNIGLFAILGLSLSAVQVLPGAELLKLSHRASVAGTISIPNQGFLPIKHLMGFFAPDYFGNPATGNWWGIGFYDNYAVYTSVVVLVLATMAFVYSKRRFQVKYLAVLLFISLILSLRTPISTFFFETNFLGFRAAVASRAMLLTNFALAILAAYGIEEIGRIRWNRKLLRVTYLPWIVLLGVFLGTLIARNWIAAQRSEYIVYPEALKIVDIWLDNLKVGLRNVILPVGVLFGTTLLLIILKYKILRRLVFLGLFILLTFDLFRFGYKYLTFTKKELVFPSTPVIDFLVREQKIAGPFRVSGGDVVPMNMLAPYGLETPEGSEALYPLSYAKFLSRIHGISEQYPFGRYGDINKFDSPLIDLANVRYILALKRDKDRNPDRKGEPTTLFDLEKLVSVFEDGTVVVLENKDAYPRAFFEEGSGELKFIDYRAGYSKILVNAEVAGKLVVSDTFYPGWESFVDGRPVEIEQVESIFRAINIPMGEHTVEFIYDPESFKIGVVVSTVSASFLIVLVIISLKPVQKYFKRSTR